MSRYSPIPAEVLDTIAALGFDVYQNPDPHWQTYLVFTDGVRLGYLQRGDFGGLSLSTMHLPCRECGTGFKLDAPRPGEPDILTREGLERAFQHAPAWAFTRDREAVRKWPSVAAWLDSRRGAMVRTREGVPAQD